MVVGVGGMGTNTVRAVKRRLRNVWGSDQLPGMIQLLALDTEPLVNRLDQEPLFADEFAYMGKFDATRWINIRRSLVGGITHPFLWVIFTMGPSNFDPLGGFASSATM